MSFQSDAFIKAWQAVPHEDRLTCAVSVMSSMTVEETAQIIGRVEHDIDFIEGVKDELDYLIQDILDEEAEAEQESLSIDKVEED